MPRCLKGAGKRIFAALCAALLLCLPAQAAEEIRVVLNGKQMQFTVAPIVQNGTTLVPIRAIAEYMDAEVGYAGSNSMTISYGKKTILLETGKPRAFVNGRIVRLALAPIVVDGTTLVPLRFISEAFDAKVSYSEASNTAYILFQREEFGPIR